MTLHPDSQSQSDMPIVGLGLLKGPGYNSNKQPALIDQCVFDLSKSDHTVLKESCPAAESTRVV